MREIGLWSSPRASGTMHGDGGEMPFLFVLCLLGPGMAAGSRRSGERTPAPEPASAFGRGMRCCGLRHQILISWTPTGLSLMVHVAFLGTHSRPLSTRPFSDKKDAPDPQFVASDKPRAEWVQPTGRGEGTPSLVGDVWARIWGTGKISEAVTPAPGPLRPTGDGWELRSARAHTPQHLHVPLPTHACEKGFHQITKCAHPFPLGPQCITHGIRRYHGGIPTSRRDQTDRLAAGRPGLYSELLSQMTECWCLVRCNVVELLSK